MPSKPRIRTYGRPKKIDSNYIPKPVSPFKITEASTVIDALFSKNIRKRNSSSDHTNVVKKKTRGRPKKIKISELPAPVHPPMLNNDSLNIKINSTFDNLLQGPVYNQVNICSNTSLYVNSSTDTSDSKIISEKVQCYYNTRKRKNKNYASHTDGTHITWEKSCNNSVLSTGKIRKKRNKPRKLKQIIKKVINISDTTDKQDITKKLHSYLDKSINYSLIVEKQSKSKTVSTENNFSCARKFTPIASTSKLLSVSNHRQDNNIFRHGFRHLMRADNSPKYIHSSTPIVSRIIKRDDKLNVSPITANAKNSFNFTTNNSKSLFGSKKLSDVSSIPNTANNTVNKNNVSSVILINSTIPEMINPSNTENVSENVIINDTVDNNNSFISIVEDNVQCKNNDEDNIISNNRFEEVNIDLKKDYFIANDVKLNGKAIVRLEKHLDVLGINGNTSVICRFANSKTEVEKQLNPVVCLEKHLDVLGINGNTSIICRFTNSRIDVEKELNPVVCLERLSVSKYFKNRGLFVTSRSRNSSKNSRISSRSQSINDELSSIEISDTSRNSNKRNSKSRISNEQSNSKHSNDTNENSVVNTNISEKSMKLPISNRSFSNNEVNNSKENYNSHRERKNLVSKSQISPTSIPNSKDLSNNNKESIRNSESKITTRLRSSGTVSDNELNIKLPTNSSKRNSNSLISTRSSSNNKYSDLRGSNKISQLRNTANSQTELNELSSMMDNTTRSMFDSYSNNIIENTAYDVSVPKNFITIRKNTIQINIEPITNNYKSDESTKPPNISSKMWEKYTQCRINLVRIEDCNELKKYGNVFRINDNRISRRKTHVNIANGNVDVDLNRKSIFLNPGKKWFRSLSILRRTNIHDIEEDRYANKGRKWRDSVYEVHEKQNNADGAFHEIGDESVVNDMKLKIRSSTRTTLGIRKSLKIVNISVKDSSVLAEKTLHENKSGYVPTLAHVSILESFDKLSLSTNVDEETARQIILKRCGQTDPIPFDDCYSSRTLKKCRKIGEGVYGEVYMYKSLDNKCRVMKVIPIEGNLVVNGERQKKFEEIISEIIIASELSNLRINNEFCTNGYAELLQISCVQGKYPQDLLDLWDLFDEERGSENDSPEIFTEDQLYIVLELANGGQDLEAHRFDNAEQSYALFEQVLCSLAVAESAMQFEHRDMHWGNILISRTDDATTTFRLKGREIEVLTRGVKVSVIDFTLSRMTYNNCCIYNDLALDPDLFTATGDYQFDIYRLMKQRNQNDWEAFEPYSNILWLDYTLEKMIGQVRYLRVTTKTHKTYIRRLSQIRKKILNYNSATELLNSDVFSHVFL